MKAKRVFRIAATVALSVTAAGFVVGCASKPRLATSDMAARASVVRTTESETSTNSPTISAPAALIPESVARAQFPLLVALGLPDDERLGFVELHTRFENRVKKCMRDKGFYYVPAITDKDDDRNVEFIDSLEVGQRERYFNALNGASGCVASIRPSVFILNSPLAATFGPYLDAAMRNPAVLAGISEIEKCMAGQTASNTLPGSALPDCTSEKFAEEKREAVRSAELKFLIDHWDAVDHFRNASANSPICVSPIVAVGLASVWMT